MGGDIRSKSSKQTVTSKFYRAISTWPCTANYNWKRTKKIHLLTEDGSYFKNVEFTSLNISGIVSIDILPPHGVFNYLLLRLLLSITNPLRDILPHHFFNVQFSVVDTFIPDELIYLLVLIILSYISKKHYKLNGFQ